MIEEMIRTNTRNEHRHRENEGSVLRGKAWKWIGMGGWERGTQNTEVVHGETKKEYDALKADIQNDEKYKSMEPYMKEACDDYYINGKTDMQIDYPGENFHRDVRNHCDS